MTSTPTESTSPQPPLVGVADVAELLGVEVRHIRRLVHERRIPFVKWGHLVRFDPNEITAWIDDHRTPAVQSRIDAQRHSFRQGDHSDGKVRRAASATVCRPTRKRLAAGLSAAFSTP
jgi:excisionase family DNA binding protein